MDEIIANNIDIFGGLIVRSFGHKFTITFHSMYAKYFDIVGPFGLP